MAYNVVGGTLNLALAYLSTYLDQKVWVCSRPFTFLWYPHPSFPISTPFLILLFWIYIKHQIKSNQIY